MTTTNHAMMGALIAVSVKQPLLALPLAFLSHFVLDALPHFAIAIIDGDVRARNRKPLFKWVTTIDVLLLIFMLVSLPILLHDQTSWLLILGCAIAAVSPDFVWVYRFLKERKTGILGKKNAFSQFHKRIQWAERPWGLWIEVPFLCLLLMVVSAL